MSPETPPLRLTQLELMWLLRRLRADKQQLQDDMTLLRERIHAGNNGQLVAGYQALDADAAVADEIIRKIWLIVPP